MMDHTLNPRLLHAAYSQGYFPMPDETTGEILWYRPDPRAIFPLDGFHVSRSLRRILNKNEYRITFNQAFSQVVHCCANRAKTWINDQFKQAYEELRKIGSAQSVEVWNYEDKLIGGVYGVNFGGAFFAESMFHRQTNGSKIALYYLVERLKASGFSLLECQFMTEHLQSLGAIEVPDHEYVKILKKAIETEVVF